MNQENEQHVPEQSTSTALTTFYALSVVTSALLTATALSHRPLFQTLTKALISRPRLANISSMVSEYAIFLVFAKIFLIYQLAQMDSFEFQGFWITSLYRLDVMTTLILWGLFLQAVFARHPVYEATKFMRNLASTTPPSIFSYSFWFRFSNPFWASRSLLIHEDVCYATEAELKAIGTTTPRAKEFLSLDVFQHPSFPRNCPVIIYIHGGQWNSGKKEERPPLISFLALKRYVVVTINHRLAPEATIHDQLCDVKKAIRWTRENITKFGGDPGFIGLVGSCAGGHLATMAAMTANDPLYQADFPLVDTSVNACVPIAGFFDVTRNWGYKFSYKFDKKLIQNMDSDVARQFSPIWRLKETEANKARVAATEEEKKGLVLPSFLVIHGESDCLAPIKHVRDFKKEFLLSVQAPSITVIELAGCNHNFYSWSSVRSHIICYGVEPFLRFNYEKFEKAKKLD